MRDAAAEHGLDAAEREETRDLAGAIDARNGHDLPPAQRSSAGQVRQRDLEQAPRGAEREDERARDCGAGGEAIEAPVLQSEG